MCIGILLEGKGTKIKIVNSWRQKGDRNVWKVGEKRATKICYNGSQTIDNYLFEIKGNIPQLSRNQGGSCNVHKTESKI